MKQTLFALLMFISASSYAGDNNEWYREFGPNGNTFIVACKSAVQKLDDAVWSGTKQQAHDAGFCMGFIAGVANSMNSNDGVDLKDGSITRDQLIRVVQKYLEDHPEQLSKPATWLVRQAIIKAFPKK